MIVNGRSEPAVDKAVAELKAETGGNLIGFAGDLADAAAAEALSRAHPNVEILVNNLGIFEPKPFEEIPDADWVRFFEVNVLSGVRLARLFLPELGRFAPVEVTIALKRLGPTRQGRHYAGRSWAA